MGIDTSAFRQPGKFRCRAGEIPVSLMRSATGGYLMTRLFPALALMALSACVSTDEPDIEPTPYPFAGTWDCEVATFTFSGNSYNNGTETVAIENVIQRENSFALSLSDGTSIALDMDGADRMQWLSGETGDTFQCTRL
jgi:hypothetical protein